MQPIVQDIILFEDWHVQIGLRPLLIANMRLGLIGFFLEGLD